MIAMTQHYLRPTDPNFYTINKKIQNDKRVYPHFKDCIGALDGIHIRVSLYHICVSLSPKEQMRYIGKTSIATQNVLSICDFNMRFTYVATDKLGSYHDTSVSYHAMEADKKEFPHSPLGKYYVVDAVYPNHPET